MAREAHTTALSRGAAFRHGRGQRQSIVDPALESSSSSQQEAKMKQKQDRPDPHPKYMTLNKIFEILVST